MRIAIIVLAASIQSSFASTHPIIPFKLNRNMHEKILNAKQLIVVRTTSWQAQQGKLQRYERRSRNNAWTAMGNEIPVVVGKNGMALSKIIAQPHLPGPYKKEGDNKTPAGIFTLDKAFGLRPLKTTYTKDNYILVKPQTICVDSPNSAFYGKIIDSSTIQKRDWQTGEHMYNYKVAYQNGLVVNYNHKQNKNAGSCIFMHVWRNSATPTAGCIAMPRQSLIAILKWLMPSKQPLLVVYSRRTSPG